MAGQPITIDDPSGFVPDGQAAPGGGIEIDAAAFVPDAPTRAVSKTESLVRGAGQGATLNFSDELIGLGKALFADGDARTFRQRYKAARDAERQANREAREANPFTYGAGEFGASVATSFIPGVGVARGASAAKTAVQAGKMSGIAGLGASEGETLPEQLTDAGKSALIGGATAGLVSRFIGNAPKRSVDRKIGDITDGATANQRDRVVGKAGERVGNVVEVLKDKPFKAAGRDAGKLLDATENAIEETGARLDDAFTKAGVTAKTRVNDVVLDLKKFATDLEKDPGKRAVARAVRDHISDIEASWITKNAPRDAQGLPVVTAQQLRVLAKDIGDTAFRGSPAVAPKQGQAVAQQIWGIIKDRMMANLDEAAQKGGASRKEIEALNKRMSTLLNMREAVRYRATRESTESTRLKDRVSGGLDIGLALVDPTSFVAKKAYDYVGKPALRVADDKLAELVTAAQNGSTAAQLAERAITLGVSPLVAQPLANWLARSLTNLEGGEAP